MVKSLKKDEVKHLEMTQAVINRLAGHSFLIKGWAITVWSAGYGLYFQTGNWQVLIVIVMATMLFWFMDTYYFRQERLFRQLFEAIADGTAKAGYSLNVSTYKVPSYFSTLFSFPTECPYALVLLFTLTWLTVSRWHILSLFMVKAVQFWLCLLT